MMHVRWLLGLPADARPLPATGTATVVARPAGAGDY
jgi:hypothetical protein